jgi:hypothetical protein
MLISGLIIASDTKVVKSVKAFKMTLAVPLQDQNELRVYPDS